MLPYNLESRIQDYKSKTEKDENFSIRSQELILNRSDDFISGKDQITPNDIFDKIFVINLNRRSDRRLYISSTLGSSSIDFEFFEAVDGQRFEKEYSEIFSNNNDVWGRVNSLGAFGCLLSFKSLIKKCIDMGFERVLILEDDILLHKDFDEKFQNTINLYNKYNVVYLGANQERWGDHQLQEMPHGYYENSRTKSNVIYGTFAISLDKLAMKKVYNRLINITRENQTIDVMISTMMVDGELSGAVVYPNLIIADVSESDNMGKRELNDFAKSRKWNLIKYKTKEEFKFVIIVAAYNNEKYIKKNLQSIYSQYYKNYRVIYIVDNSSDNSYAILNEIANKKNTRIIRNKYQCGPAYSRYLGYNLCNNDEVAIMLDGDDFLSHSKVLDYLNNYYNAGYDHTFGSFRLIKRRYDRIAKDYPIEIIKKRLFRKYELPPSHLRTMKVESIKSLSVLNLFDPLNNFVRLSTDYLDMFHSLEHSSNPKAIPQVLLDYNDESSEEHKTSWFNLKKNKLYRDTINNKLLNNRSVSNLNDPKNNYIIPLELKFKDPTLFNVLIGYFKNELMEENNLYIFPSELLKELSIEYLVLENFELKNGLTYLIPNFNNEEFLDEAISSLLNQEVKDFSIIICDDCSTDKSLEKINKYLDVGLDIKLIKNDENLGVGATTSLMLKHSRTYWNSILDPDDTLSSDNSKELLNVIQQIDPKEYSFIYTNFNYCDLDMNFLSLGFSRQIPPRKTNLESNVVSANRVINKYFYYQTEGFDSELIIAEDKDIIYKLEEVGKLYFIDKPLYNYRSNPNSLTHNYSKELYFDLAREKAYRRRKEKKIVLDFFDYIKS